MKIVLAYLCDFADRNDYYASLLPVGLLSIAAYLEKNGHTAVISNLSSLGWKKGCQEILGHKPDVVGVSVYTHNRIESHKLINELTAHKKKFHIMLGGPHVTFLADEDIKRFPGVDYIISGEGEAGVLKVLESLNSKKTGRQIIEEKRLDPSVLPAPSYFSGTMTGVNWNEQFKYIISSRGCPHSCSYCSSPSYWMRKTTFREVDDIIDEMAFLKNKYGIIYFGIRDDNFTLKKKRVMEFAEKLKERNLGIMWNCQSRVDTIDYEMLLNMKIAGLEHIQYGVESGSERILAKYDKRISLSAVEKACAEARRAGVYLSVYLMTGMTGEDRSDVEKTKALLKKIMPGDVLVSPVAYYPGTALYNEAKAEGLIADADWFSPPQGRYLRDDKAAVSAMNDLLNYSAVIKDKAWYKEQDFLRHRRETGGDWVTEILFGDFCLDHDMTDEAIDKYARSARYAPGNPWPPLRLGKAKFFAGDYEAALDHYKSVIDLVPNYYGAYLKAARCSVACGSLDNARKYIEKVKILNPFEERVSRIEKAIKGFKNQR